MNHTMMTRKAIKVVIGEPAHSVITLASLLKVSFILVSPYWANRQTLLPAGLNTLYRLRSALAGSFAHEDQHIPILVLELGLHHAPGLARGHLGELHTARFQFFVSALDVIRSEHEAGELADAAGAATAVAFSEND